MRPEIKKEWVRRLRSGDYRQGKGRLAQKGAEGDWQFCCLGVLCEVAVEAEIISKHVEPGMGGATWKQDDVMVYSAEHDHSPVLLPYAILKWAGLDHRDPIISLPAALSKRVPYEGPEQIRLSYCNDERGFEFNVIADLIEASL